jgi:hypothetical protein
VAVESVDFVGFRGGGGQLRPNHANPKAPFHSADTDCQMSYHPLMHIRSYLRLLLLLVVSVTSAVAAPPSDAEATKLILGEWVMPLEQFNAVVKGGGFHFKEDGTFSSKGLIILRGENVRIEFDGTWSIKDGVLTETITRSSHPALVVMGSVTRDSITSLTDKEYRVRTEKGNEERYVRP